MAADVRVTNFLTTLTLAIKGTSVPAVTKICCLR